MTDKFDRTLDELAAEAGDKFPFEVITFGKNPWTVIGRTRLGNMYVLDDGKLLNTRCGCEREFRFAPPEPKKPREWWVAVRENDGWPYNWVDYPIEGYCHVREVLPNTVTISRADLEKAWTSCQLYPKAEFAMSLTKLASALGLESP